MAALLNLVVGIASIGALTGIGATAAEASYAPAPAAATAAAAPGAIHPDTILDGLRSEVRFTDDASAHHWISTTLGYTDLADRQLENFTFVELHSRHNDEGTSWVARFNFAMTAPGSDRMQSRVLDVTYGPDGTRTTCIPGPSITGNDRLADTPGITFADATHLVNTWRTAHGWDTNDAIDSVTLRDDINPYSQFDGPQIYFTVENDSASVLAVDTDTGTVTHVHGDDHTPGTHR